MGEEEEAKVERRDYIKYAGTFIGALVVGAAAGWLVPKPAAPAEVVTKTVEKTVTTTVTAAPPPVTPTPTPTPTPVPTPTPTPTPAKPEYEGVELTVIGDAGHNQMPFYWMKDPIEKNLGITYEIVGVPFEELVEKIMTDFATETGAYDVVVFPPPAGGDFYAGEYLTQLDPYMEKWDIRWDDMITCFRELYCSLGGKRYSLTWDGDYFNFYYRFDIFEDPKIKAAFKEKYGYDLVPGAMRYDKDVLDAAKFFTKAYNPDSPTEYGTSEIASVGNCQWWFFSRLGSAGGIYFDDDLHPLINSDEGVRALTAFKDVIPYCPPGVLEFGYEEHKDAFLMGPPFCAFLVQWPCVGKKAEAAITSHCVGKVKHELVPGFDVEGKLNQRGNMAWGRVLAVSKFCKNPEAAYRFIHFLTGEASWWGTKWVADPRTGLDPYRYYHTEHPELWRKRWKEEFELAEMEWPTLEAYLAASKKNIEHGYPEITIPGTFEYYDKLSVNISSCLAGEISPKDALDRTAAEWEKITDRLGRDRQKKMWADLKVGWKTVGLL